MKWEYLVSLLSYIPEFPAIQEDLDSLTQHLNDMGQSGWEMVAVDNGLIYFKRTLGVELEVMKAEFTEGVVEEMIDIVDKAVKRMAQRGT